ncbi:protein of unknown function [Hyphomicrobium sp. 1Nfss2.1]
MAGFGSRLARRPLLDNGWIVCRWLSPESLQRRFLCLGGCGQTIAQGWGLRRLHLTPIIRVCLGLLLQIGI